MNKNIILTKAGSIFDSVNTINDDLYKAELYIGSRKPAGIYYLDFSDCINTENFNDYQEKLLAKEYFENSGNLQWNFYLLFFQDQFDSKKRREIEKNDKYARKYIFTESEFEDFFNLERSKGILTSNIVLEWKEKLDNVNLQVVYSEEAVAPAVENFFEGKVKKNLAKERNDKVNKEVLKVNFINNIELTDKYRPFPKEIRKFNFKKVNLIKGINGVGKTSLFEAIELMLCGRTNRNPDKNELDGAINSGFNNSEIIYKYTTGQNKLFRERDLYWYSNNYPRDNNLFASFNRYNFYNSDSAYNFSSSNDEKQVKDALFNLVLGAEYNYIKERSEKFYGYIKTEHNKLQKDIDTNNSIIKETEKLINSLKTKVSLEKIKQNILVNIKSIKPKSTINVIEENYSELELLINKIKTLLEKIKENENYPKSIKELDERIKSLANKKSVLDLAINEYNQLSSEINNIHKLLQEFSGNITFIKECRKYFPDEKLFEIEGLSTRRENIINNINKINRSIDNLKDIEINSYNFDIRIPDYVNKQNVLLDDLKKEKKSVDDNLKELLNKLGKTEKIIKEIKLLGQQFIVLNGKATNCPLCESTFNSIELKARIENISKDENTLSAQRIKELHNKQKELEILIDKLNINLNSVSKIRTSYLILFPEENLKNKMLIEVLSSIANENIRIDELNKVKKEIEEIESLIKTFNVSESEFTYLKNKIKENYPSITFEFKNRDKFIKLNTELQQKVEKSNSDIEKLTLKKAELISNLKGKLELFTENEKLDINSIKEKVLSEENILNRLDNFFNELSKLLNIDKSDSIDGLDLTISVLSKNINSLKIELKNQFEMNAALKRKEKSEEYIKDNTEKFDRIKKAKTTLEYLSSNEGNKQMEEFFNNNLIEILDIFKTIHVPKEFVNISFDHEQLTITDINNKKRKISEISTGQRSALALSIFICLNRKLKNGPNIIMFDDPISFIDDFNALSFLDFLRYFVLKENKQIFFATANTKLASLFEKKFEFLEDDFKKWDLVRESN